MKYLNKKFTVYPNQSKKYADGYDNINWDNKCKDCDSALTLLGLLKNGKERWFCTKCCKVYEFRNLSTNYKKRLFKEN